MHVSLRGQLIVMKMPQQQQGEAQFVRVAVHDDIVTAVPVGPSIGEREAGIVNEQIATVMTPLGKSLRALVLDMRQVNYMASVGIGMCVDLHNRAKAASAPAIVLGMNENLMQLFKMLKLTRLFTIVADEVALETELGKVKK